MFAEPCLTLCLFGSYKLKRNFRARNLKLKHWMHRGFTYIYFYCSMHLCSPYFSLQWAENGGFDTSDPLLCIITDRCGFVWHILLYLSHAIKQLPCHPSSHCILSAQQGSRLRVVSDTVKFSETKHLKFLSIAVKLSVDSQWGWEPSQSVLMQLLMSLFGIHESSKCICCLWCLTFCLVELWRLLILEQKKVRTQKLS